jgi:hypothetical protein
MLKLSQKWIRAAVLQTAVSRAGLVLTLVFERMLFPSASAFKGKSLSVADFDALIEYVELFKKHFERVQKRAPEIETVFSFLGYQNGFPHSARRALQAR